MDAERWGRVKQVFDLAADAPPAQQRSIVESSCSGDPDLIAEVLRLLESNASAGDFLEDAAGDLHAYLQPENRLPRFDEGDVLARRFEIRRFINSGGMGEVYEAWDRELNQEVAVKTILPYIAVHAEVIERFKQEVRHTREISHPNICRVHELFLHDEAGEGPTWFLSMELLQGPTLLEKIRLDGRLAPELGVLVASQLLSGIEAAHAQGLTHRDFKSSNVILVDAENGHTRAVITDFGLSLRIPPGEASVDAVRGMGTPGYMAPEQEEQGRVSPLADQYALGVVLYEMMAGSLPQPTTIGGAARSKAAKQGYPARWDGVIRRCMQRNPEDRFEDIAAVRKALLLPAWRRHPRLLAIASIALVTVGGVFLLRAVRAPKAEPCQICEVRQLTPDTDESESPSLSRDGKYLAYSSDQAESGNLDIFVQPLPSGTLRRITHDRSREGDPSISPDGSIVAYRSERNGGGIYIASVQDPEEATLLVPRGRNPAISPDGQRLLYWTGDPDQSNLSGKLYVMSLTGGVPVQLAPMFLDARFPVWSTDGTSVLFGGCAGHDQSPQGCYDWWTMKIDNGVPHATNAFAKLRSVKILPSRLNSVNWIGDSLIFSAVGDSRRSSLFSLKLDTNSLEATDQMKWLLNENAADLDPSVSSHEDIAFTRTSGALHIWRITGAGKGQRHELEKITQDADVDGTPFVAEGGRVVVYERGRKRERQILLRDMTSGKETTLIDSGTSVLSPIIDSAQKWIAYWQIENDGRSAIYAGQLGGTMKRVCVNCMEPMGWFQHDKKFFFRDEAHGTVNMMDVLSGTQKIILQASDRSIGDVSWSSESGLLLFTESRSDRKQIYAVHLNPQTGEADPTWLLIPTGAGTPWHPRWSGDGKTIFYVSNSDGFSCVYGLSFIASTRKFGVPFDVAHFHKQRASIDNVLPRAFNMSVAGETIYLNLGEQSSTIQLGKLVNHP
ncbi:protein kinase [Terriglobus sp. TAA 43]|uniref:protein kinase domain-containing protein n=1 Tax=Terriglobus sp. TAA 43 TaxID=278961 RepID=UPI000645DB67|nr:protein kinase [Terriglobus sp. TAA 43]